MASDLLYVVIEGLFVPVLFIFCRVVDWGELGSRRTGQNWNRRRGLSGCHMKDTVGTASIVGGRMMIETIAVWA